MAAAMTLAILRLAHAPEELAQRLVPLVARAIHCGKRVLPGDGREPRMVRGRRLFGQHGIIIASNVCGGLTRPQRKSVQ